MGSATDSDITCGFVAFLMFLSNFPFSVGVKVWDLIQLVPEVYLPSQFGISILTSKHLIFSSTEPKAPGRFLYRQAPSSGEVFV